MSEDVIQQDFDECEELLRVGKARKDYIEANCERIDIWREAAESGDAQAQVLYGLCHSYGSGVEEDLAEAFAWFEKAAAQGNAQGELSLGNAYFYGFGIDEDYSQSFHCFEKSASQGNADAMYRLAGSYVNGWGTEGDPGLGSQWALKAANLGNQDAQYYAGLLFGLGLGVDACKKTSIDWFQKAVASGHKDAMYQLGIRYYRSKVKGDKVKARELFRQADLTLDEDLAQSYINDHHSVFLPAYSYISDNAAETLSMRRWLLDIPAPSIHQEVLACGHLNLSGLIELSDAAAKSLSKLKGTGLSLVLCGLTELSDAAAESLSKLKGDLNLDGLTELSDAAAKHLGKHEGLLALDGLKSLSDVAAESLAKHPNLSINLDNLPASAAQILRDAGHGKRGG